jgi:glutathione synthase/RimK-type ligase-like ATP-grasp enzyme
MAELLFSLITYSALPDLDPDDQLVKAALERRGAKVQALVWDDENVDWSKAGICVLRSTWDYHLSYEKFCHWVDKVGQATRLFNPAQLVLWNSRKTYLNEMIQAGLPVIPTSFLDNDANTDLSQLLQQRGWRKAVIKPTVGLATSGVKCVENTPESLEEGQQHLNQLLKNGVVMVQEYLEAVEGYGERSLTFIDGKFSHCIRKTAFQKLAVAGRAGETAQDVSEDELVQAQKILSYLKETPLYARVDLVRDRNNQPLLMELELVEPSLFLQTKPSAAELFAEALLGRVLCHS